MIFAAKIVAEGQLPSTKTTLFTCPDQTSTFISFISVYNTNTTTEAVKLYYKKSGGTSRIIYGESLLADMGDYPFSEVGGIVLSAGDQIECMTTTASEVDYCIFAGGDA